MRRAVLLIVLVMTAFAPAGAQVAGADQEQVVIWYLPHPDDETIGMAGAITASVQAGNRNIVVFFTQGGNTLVRVRAEQPRGVAGIKKARVKEAKTALAVLGVAPKDVVFYDLPDGRVHVKQALQVMRQFHELYPQAAMRTVSMSDQHPDHQALAAALTMLAREAESEVDVAFYRVYAYASTRAKRRANGVVAERVPDPARKRAALAVYTKYDPQRGHYAIGGRSVPGLISAAADDPYEYRDDGFLPIAGFAPAHIAVEPSSIMVGTTYVSALSAWRVGVRQQALPTTGLTIQLDYRLANLPAFGDFYVGGAFRVAGQPSGPYFLMGASALNMLYAEYRRALSKRNSSGFHIGVRLQWPQLSGVNH